MSLDTDVQMLLDGLHCPDCGDGLDNCELVYDDNEGEYYRCKGCGCKFDEKGKKI